MKFLLDNWYLVLTALVSGGLLLWTQLSRGGGANRVSTAEAVTLINREKAVLIDVSEPAEYATVHALNAKNIPFGSLETAPTGAKGLPANKATPVLVICPTGARASRAVGTLKKMGFERPSAVIGGLGAWREAQLPIEKAATEKASA